MISLPKINMEVERGWQGTRLAEQAIVPPETGYRLQENRSWPGLKRRFETGSAPYDQAKASQNKGPSPGNSGEQSLP